MYYLNMTFIGFRWTICLERKLSPFFWQIFMPTFFMVALSWIGFLVPPNCYPGRISLLVTIVLCIISVMTSAMHESPESTGLSAMNCWFLICLVQVAIASLEYAIIIYFMRFSKQNQSLPKERVSKMAKKMNIKETTCVSGSRVDSIDHFSLLVVPSSFILMIIVYFSVFLSSSSCNDFI